MKDLAEFLLARIAERAGAAQAASAGGRWCYEDGDSVGAWTLYDEHWRIADLVTYRHEVYDYAERIPAARHPRYVDADANGAHIALNDPAFVLADCEAKRRIVAWHRLIDGLDTEDNPVRGCGNCIASGAESPYLIAGPCMTVRLLALPYADHPDYRPEWKP